CSERSDEEGRGRHRSWRNGQMSESHKGSILAGAGGIGFGLLTVIAIVVGGAPGGDYVEADVARYVGIAHFPTVVVTAYLALLGVVGLICLLAYLREMIGAQADRSLTASIFWGIGLASAASFGVVGAWSAGSRSPRPRAAAGQRC